MAQRGKWAATTRLNGTLQRLPGTWNCATTPLQKQELVNGVTRSYWEGAVRYHGREAGTAVSGEGYLEMTGYERRPR